MGVTTLTLPRLGETMEEARVTDWLKRPGEAFQRGDVLLEVETDKTVVEVPALTSGTLVAQLVAPGEMVALGQPIAEVEVAGIAEAAPPAGSGDAEGPDAGVSHPRTPVGYFSRKEATASVGAGEVHRPGAEVAETISGRVAASPKARRAARRAGLALGGLTGTGRNGRIMAADLPLPTPANDAGFEVIEGIALRRLGTGVGTPVLLLHGLFDQGRGWRDLPERLARAGHPVLVADLPGHGQSTVTVAHPAEAAGRLATALARVLPQGPLRLAGHSVGALVAAHLARGLGARCEGLALIAPAGLGTRLNGDFIAGMVQAETIEALRRALGHLGSGPLSEAMLADELARLRPLRAGLAPFLRSVVIDGVQQADLPALLRDAPVPAVAILGLEDRIVDWRDCAALPPETAIHLLPGAGHLPHLAHPDLVTRLILGPLRQSPEVRARTA